MEIIKTIKVNYICANILDFQASSYSNYRIMGNVVCLWWQYAQLYTFCSEPNNERENIKHIDRKQG